VVRFPYQNGDLKARGPAEHIADVPQGQATGRAISGSRLTARRCLSPWLRVQCGRCRHNAGEKNRANVLEFNPDGSTCAFTPTEFVIAWHGRGSGTGEVWCSVNERDGWATTWSRLHHAPAGRRLLRLALVVHGRAPGPAAQGKHPELKDKVITPDVILHPHNASLEMTIYDGKQFPAEYQGDIFASEHGSWNRGTRVGYEVIRVPRHQTGTPAASMRTSLPVLCLRMATSGDGPSELPWRRMARCW